MIFLLKALWIVIKYGENSYKGSEWFKESLFREEQIYCLIDFVIWLRKYRCYFIADKIKASVLNCGYYYQEPCGDYKSNLLGKIFKKLELRFLKNNACTIEGYIYHNNTKYKIFYHYL